MNPIELKAEIGQCFNIAVGEQTKQGVPILKLKADELLADILYLYNLKQEIKNEVIRIVTNKNE